MKRILMLGTILLASALGTNAFAAAFTGGNIVVCRFGDGTGGSLTNCPIYLDEYQTNGTFVQTIRMPTNYFGAFSPLIASGTAAAEGLLTRSQDGRFLLLTGYGTYPGTNTFSNNGSMLGADATRNPRVVAVVDGNANINTTTVMTNSDMDGFNIRSAASNDGTNLWFSGDNGVFYTTRGSNDNTAIGQFNMRALNITSNQLYVSSQSGSVPLRIATVGSGLPTTTGQLYTNLSGLVSNTSSPYQYCFVKQRAGAAEPADTLYIADDGADITTPYPNGVYKWSLVGGTWVNNGSINAFRPRGVTASVDYNGGTTNVHLFITGGGSTITGGDTIKAPIDSSGYNHNPALDAADFIIVPTVTLKSFRGIAFAPVGSEPSPTNSGPGRLSVGPIIRYNSSGYTGGPFKPATNIYSVANLGANGNNISYAASGNTNWFTVSPATTNSLAGGASAKVTVSINANATSLDGGNSYTGTVTFLDLTNSVSTTRELVLTIDALNIIQTAFFHANGPIGGPFTTNYVYTLTNSASSAALWSVTNLSTWLVYSATNGNLAGHTGTNITFSIGSAATAFTSRGPHTDVITFRDVSRNKLIDTRDATLQVGLGFYDDFCASPFVNGNLVGQGFWYEAVGTFTTSDHPIQINACKAWEDPAVPTGADWQQVAKDFGSITMSNNDVFAGMVVTVTNASSVAVPSYNVGLDVFPGDIGGDNPNFRNYRFNAQQVSSTTFHFGARANGFSLGPVYGSALSYGTAYNVIIRAHQGGTNMTIYVNPTSAVLGDQVADATDAMTSGYPATLGALALSQFAGNNGGLAGMGFGRISVSTNFAEVYNELTGGGPPSDPYSTWAGNYGLSGGNAAGGVDPDGDGMSNTNEFLAGFAPNNSEARLRIISIARTSGTNATITYLGANGDASHGGPSSRTNVLESTTGTAGSYSSTFVSTGLTNILSGGTGVGQTTSFVHTNGATGPMRYYRVRVLVP